jgi:hypothetical protein
VVQQFARREPVEADENLLAAMLTPGRASRRGP